MMKEKTAIQQLIEEYEKAKTGCPNDIIIQAFIDEARKHLPAEQKAIEEAYVAGMNDDTMSEQESQTIATDYFTSKYTNNG